MTGLVPQFVLDSWNALPPTDNWRDRIVAFFDREPKA